MPCNHDAARNLLGIGWVHTVFLLIPGRSTHGHRQAQVRKKWEKQVGQGKGKEGKSREEKRRSSGFVPLHCVSGWSHLTSMSEESESKNCAAKRSKMGLGDKSLLDISSGNISCGTRTCGLMAKSTLKGIKPECECLFISAQLLCVIISDMSTNDMAHQQNKKKCCDRITGETWRKCRTPPSADSVTDGTLNANHNQDQLTQPPHQHRCWQHWTWHGERSIILQK